MTQTSRRMAWLVVPALLFLLLFFLYPLLLMLQRSISEPSWGLHNFVRIANSSTYLRVLLNTLRMALAVTFFCLLLGYPYAYVMTLAKPRWAGLLLIAVLIPFWSSILVRTYAWTVLLQDSGVINSLLLELRIIARPLRLMRNFTGVVIGMTHVLLPFMVLPLYAVMQRIDLDLLRAAQSLGARPAAAFRQVFLPLSLPGVYAGCLLVFVVALGYYITPTLLGSPRETMMGDMVVQQIQQVRNWGMGSALGVVLLAATLLLLAFVARVVNINAVLGGEEL